MKIQFTVMVRDLSVNKFAELVRFCQLQNLPYSVKDQILIEPEAKPNGRTSIALDDYIRLGKNFATVSNKSLGGKIVAEVQTYEKKHGAGEMTKRKLRDNMKKHSAAPDAAIGLAIKNGVIKGV